MIRVLAAKELPDGTFLLAFTHGPHSVTLVHQAIFEYSVTFPNPHNYSWVGPEGLRADIKTVTLKTRIITREEFDAGGYEKTMGHPMPIFHTPLLERPKS